LARLLSFVNIFVESPLMGHVLEELEKLPNTEQLYEVTGDFDITCVLSTVDVDEFRDILVNRIMKIKGVRSTVTALVLHSHEISRGASGA